MKKGCIIALAALVLVVIAFSVWFFRSAAPKLQNAYTLRLIQDVEFAFAQYAKAHDGAPEGTIDEMVENVRGNNPHEMDYFEGRVDGQVVEGEIVDAWRRPLKFEVDPKGVVRFTSAGLNGQFGDGDDLTSAGTKGPKLPKPSG